MCAYGGVLVVFEGIGKSLDVSNVRSFMGCLSGH